MLKLPENIGVSIVMGVPPSSLDGFCERENPNYKWMMTGGTPILGTPHVVYFEGILWDNKPYYGGFMG